MYAPLIARQYLLLVFEANFFFVFIGEFTLARSIDEGQNDWSTAQLGGCQCKDEDEINDPCRVVALPSSLEGTALCRMSWVGRNTCLTGQKSRV
jgi:hypothetical protein